DTGSYQRKFASSKPHVASVPELAWIAAAHVELRGKVGRFVPEVETSHRVIFVERVAHPELGRPALRLEPDARIGQGVALCFLVVADVERALIPRGSVGARGD